jgi:membrane protease YdiL (CAAX protease family)
LGLAAASFGVVVVVAAILTPLLEHAKRAIASVPTGHVPAYYVIWGLSIAAVTSVTEEVFVNGYLLTRLAQLGWSPKKAFTLSLILRTSYHVYYGIGFLFTIPFGVFVTRSFQKHRRLNRAIAAHFLYDAVLITISILSASALFKVL